MVGPARVHGSERRVRSNVGGSYRIAMQPPEGELFHLVGSSGRSNLPPGSPTRFGGSRRTPDDRETVATLSLEERRDETELRLIQGEFSTEERRELHEARMDRLFRAARGAARLTARI